MSEKTVQEIMDEAQEKFGEGWAWGLVSTLSPGIVRIQLHSDGEEEDMMRRCVEAPTFEEAVEEAIKFTNENDVNECIEKSMGSIVIQNNPVVSKPPSGKFNLNLMSMDNMFS